MSGVSVRALVLAAGGVVVAAAAANAEPWQLYASHHHKGGAGGGGNHNDSFPFTENFDSYTAGSFNFPCAVATPGCTGANGFGLWAVAETSTLLVPGPNNASISTAHALSAPNSMLFAMPATDIVQTGSVTSGQWVVHVDTYFPSGVNTAPSANAYIIVMNTYNPPTFANANWSVQYEFSGSTGMIVNGNTGLPIAPFVYDQWVPAEVLIDIAADTYTLKYNGNVIFGPSPYSTALGAGAHAIACLDLFSDDATGVYYDNVSIQPAAVNSCYANCDGSTAVPFLNVNDFICFQNRFAAGDTYANCDHSTNPPVLNVNDFVCFQSSFAAGCSAP